MSQIPPVTQSSTTEDITAPPPTFADVLNDLLSKKHVQGQSGAGVMATVIDATVDGTVNKVAGVVANDDAESLGIELGTSGLLGLAGLIGKASVVWAGARVKHAARAAEKAKRKNMKVSAKEVLADEAEAKAAAGPETLGEQAGALRQKILRLKTLPQDSDGHRALSQEVEADRAKLQAAKEAKAQARAGMSPEEIARQDELERRGQVAMRRQRQEMVRTRVRRAVAVRTGIQLAIGRVRDVTIGKAALALAAHGVAAGQTALGGAAAGGGMLGGLAAAVAGMPLIGTLVTAAAAVTTLAVVALGVNKAVHAVTGQDGPITPLVDYLVTCALNGGNKKKCQVAAARMAGRYKIIGQRLASFVPKPKAQAKAKNDVAVAAEVAAADIVQEQTALVPPPSTRRHRAGRYRSAELPATRARQRHSRPAAFTAGGA